MGEENVSSSLEYVFQANNYNIDGVVGWADVKLSIETDVDNSVGREVALALIDNVVAKAREKLG